MKNGVLLFFAAVAAYGGFEVGRAAMSKAEAPKGESHPGKRFMDNVVAFSAVIGGLAYVVTQLPEIMADAERLYKSNVP
jgi:hypothetical protein